MKGSHKAGSSQGHVRSHTRRSSIAPEHAEPLLALRSSYLPRRRLSSPGGAQVHSQGRKPLDSEPHRIRSPKGAKEVGPSPHDSVAPLGLSTTFITPPRGLHPWRRTFASAGAIREATAHRFRLLRLVGSAMAVWMMLTATSPLWAYPKGYSPFESGKEPPRAKLAELPVIDRVIPPADQSGLELTFGEAHSRSPKIRVRQHDDGSWLTLIGANGDTILPACRVTTYKCCASAAYRGDLNQDGKPDYVLHFPSGGCGLGAEYYDRVLLLSIATSYVVLTEPTVSPGPEDFVRLPPGRGCQIVHTTFVYGEEGKDKRTHNYWAYHLLQIDGDKITLSTADPRLPRWVLYTTRSNHKDTNQLTEEQKKRLLREATGNGELIDSFIRKAGTSATRPAPPESQAPASSTHPQTQPG